MGSIRTDLRNVAIIAHVDHGKTTLVDGLLRQASVFHEKKVLRDRVLDSNDLERERGITILSKNTAIEITDPESGQLVKINIVDTPGHSDFGGEVERVLNMVDGVLLLVDAAEGPRPQTRFVLKKALELNHKVIVVINKVDRKFTNIDQVLNDTFDLFIELGASEDQANFPVVYTIATQHRAGYTPEVGPDLQPLFETILESIPSPTVRTDHPLQLLVTSLEYDNFRGSIAIGRIFAGEITVGEHVVYLTSDSQVIPGEITYLYDYQGLGRREINQARAGEIVAVAGLNDITIGDTISTPIHRTSPQDQGGSSHRQDVIWREHFTFFGKEGVWKTSRKLRERLSGR